MADPELPRLEKILLQARAGTDRITGSFSDPTLLKGDIQFEGGFKKSNRKVPTLQAIEPCDSKTAPTAEIDSRSSPYQFFTVDCLTAAL